jgi:hypothetical protein
MSQLLYLAIFFAIAFAKMMLYFTLSTITKINNLLFADDHVIRADSEHNLQRGVFTL